jgi:hypothetical protein
MLPRPTYWQRKTVDDAHELKNPARKGTDRVKVMKSSAVANAAHSAPRHCMNHRM